MRETITTGAVRAFHLLKPAFIALGGILLPLAEAAAEPSTPVFDVHVHLWKGDAPLQLYKAQMREGGLEVAGIGAMWFGGINQALAGRPAQIRAGNDRILALAAKDARVVPIVTVHPYDGEEAIAELERVAAKGAKVLKIHPHTQRFDPADPMDCFVVSLLAMTGAA